MLCPSCNKFAAFDTSAEPEVDVDVSEVALETVTKDGSEETEDPDHAVVTISGNARILLTSECCGDEMKEATFDIDITDVEVSRSEGCTCDFKEVTAEVSTSELTDRSESTKTTTPTRGPNKGKQIERPIPYRYQRRFYGVSVEVTVSCGCGKSTTTATFEDEVQASGMDELT